MASSPLESCLALWYRLNSFRIFAEPSAVVLPATAIVCAALVSIPQGLLSPLIHILSAVHTIFILSFAYIIWLLSQLENCLHHFFRYSKLWQKRREGVGIYVMDLLAPYAASIITHTMRWWKMCGISSFIPFHFHGIITEYQEMLLSSL